MAAYGIIRAIVAELPRHNAKNPSLTYVLRKNSIACRNEYGISLLQTNRKIELSLVNHSNELLKYLLNLKIDFGSIERCDTCFRYSAGRSATD